MKKQEWFGLAQASLELERGNTYVSAWLRRHPGRLPSEILTETGKVKLISEDGIEWVRSHIKKEGAPVSNRTAHEDCSLEAQLLGFTLPSYYFTILRGGLRRAYQLAQPDTANGGEAMKIERWQDTSGKIVHDDKNALLVDDDEQLDEKELAKRLREDSKSIEEVRKATFRKTLKK